MQSARYAPGSQLKIVIKYGKNLYDTETFGEMDPYVQVVLGSRQGRTRERTDAGRNPVFEEEILLDFQNETEVDFRVWDSESMGSDKIIGEAKVSIQAVINNGGSWAGDLQLYRDGRKAAGILNVYIFLVAAQVATSSGIHTGPSAPGLYKGSQSPTASGIYPDPHPEYNPHYQAGAVAMGPAQPQPAPMASVQPQAVYAQPVMAQPSMVVGQPVMAQPGIVYAQPQVVYAQPTVYGQPQVVFRPPGNTIIYR
jgi:hypothetical protein